MKKFIKNENRENDLPEFITLKEKIMRAIEEKDNKKENLLREVIHEFHEDLQISKGLVSLQNDYSTTYEMYIHVQNEIVRAFNEMKEEKSMTHFRKHYKDLSKTQQISINTIIPMQISEAEPRQIVKAD